MDKNCNCIHFKTIHMILMILAKQMQTLERNVAIALEAIPPKENQIVVNEIKIVGLKDTKKDKAKHRMDRHTQKNYYAVYYVQIMDKDKSRAKKDKKSTSRKSETAMAYSSSTNLESLMAPFDNTKKHNKEKLVLVSTSNRTTPDGNIDQDSYNSFEDELAPKSIVTMEQFQALVARVINLQKLYEKTDISDSDDVDKIMSDQHTISDPMAIVQLSSRLEASENALKGMLSLLADLASRTPGVMESQGSLQEIPGIFTPSSFHPMSYETSSGTSPRGTTLSPGVMPKGVLKHYSKYKDEPIVRKQFFRPMLFNKMMAMIPSQSETSSNIDETKAPPEKKKITKNFDGTVSFQTMVFECQDFYDSLTNDFLTGARRTILMANSATNLASKINDGLNKFDSIQSYINDAENIVQDYAEAVTDIDTNLSETMTEFNEELGAMQYKLDDALQELEDNLSKIRGDPEAIEELKYKLKLFGMELHHTRNLQNNLVEAEGAMEDEVEALRNQLRVLNELKADRDEMNEKIKGKLGNQELNGLISKSHYGASIGDLQKRISQAYTLFNTTELQWQKVIDDLEKNCITRTDKQQVESVRENINKHIQTMNEKVDFMLSVASRQFGHDHEKKPIMDQCCISCSGTKLKDLTIPPLKKFRPMPYFKKYRKHSGFPVDPKLSDEVKVVKERSNEAQKHKRSKKKRKEIDSEALICYPRRPIPHPLDSRGKLCPQICGGILPKIHAPEASSSSLVVYGKSLREKEAIRKEFKKPCIPCKKTLVPIKKEEEASDMSFADDYPDFATPRVTGVTSWLLMEWW